MLSVYFAVAVAETGNIATGSVTYKDMKLSDGSKALYSDSRSMLDASLAPFKARMIKMPFSCPLCETSKFRALLPARFAFLLKIP